MGADAMVRVAGADLRRITTAHLESAFIAADRARRTVGANREALLLADHHSGRPSSRT
jgi:hypothetical protein